MKPNGGQAFPRGDFTDGMSLRDYFAGIALRCMVGNNMFINTNFEEKVVRAYAYADAMLAEREKE